MKLPHYTKSYANEVEELSKQRKWVPSTDFCDIFSQRYEEGKRRAEELEDDVDDPFPLLSSLENLATCWALYNNFTSLEQAFYFGDIVSIHEWCSFYSALNSNDKNDIEKAIELLEDIKNGLIKN